jgi:hypothetical protein
MTTPDQPTLNEVPDEPDALEEQSNQMEVGNSESIPEVVIDHFPSASTGALITSMSHGTVSDELHQDMMADLLWSPFISQCDWLFAH